MDSINLSKKTFCQVGYSSSPISENALLAIKVGKSQQKKKKEFEKSKKKFSNNENIPSRQIDKQTKQV
jgi:hypothetical protein